MWQDASHRHQSGVIAFRVGSEGVEVLLLTSRDTGRFVIPKGNINPGESPRDAGAREASEEAGIIGRFDSDLPLGFFTYPKRTTQGPLEPTTVEVYPLRVERQRKRWREQKARQLFWVSPERAAELVDEPSLAELLLRFAEIVRPA